jgi:LacI family transcriptional regulator
MALGVMAVANRMRLDLPSQLSVAGFDDTPGAKITWPQLTTVRQPIAAMAGAAADMLMHGVELGRGRAAALAGARFRAGRPGVHRTGAQPRV